MRDIDCELSMQRYEDLLREAEEYRLARELGFSESDTLRSIAAKLRSWLSQFTSPEVTSSEAALTRSRRSGGSSQSST